MRAQMQTAVPAKAPNVSDNKGESYDHGGPPEKSKRRAVGHEPDAEPGRKAQRPVPSGKPEAPRGRVKRRAGHALLTTGGKASSVDDVQPASAVKHPAAQPGSMMREKQTSDNGHRRSEDRCSSHREKSSGNKYPGNRDMPASHPYERPAPLEEPDEVAMPLTHKRLLVHQLQDQKGQATQTELLSSAAEKEKYSEQSAGLVRRTRLGDIEYKQDIASGDAGRYNGSRSSISDRHPSRRTLQQEAVAAGRRRLQCLLGRQRGAAGLRQPSTSHHQRTAEPPFTTHGGAADNGDRRANGRYVWPEWMSDSGVGTGELSELEMQRTLKRAQEYRQQLELKLELAKVKQARALQQSQGIEEVPSKLEVRPQEVEEGDLPGFKIILERDDIESKPPFRSSNLQQDSHASADRVSEDERLALVGACDTGRDGVVEVEADIEALGALGATQAVEGFEASDPGFKDEGSSHGDSASLIDEQDTQAQLVASPDPACDSYCAHELPTSGPPPRSPVVIVTDLEYESRYRDDDEGLAHGAGWITESVQALDIDPTVLPQGSDEGRPAGSDGRQLCDGGLDVISLRITDPAIPTSDTSDGATMSGMSPPARCGEVVLHTAVMEVDSPAAINAPRSAAEVLSDEGGSSVSTRVELARAATRQKARALTART
ncbi:hypothetical protein HPB49_019518 [Dermacentor silvarum]|uniref:Uncharacterized protein n=1 Tax=Dermacentor silvarum TaxID=543639 RepID=A0ACB8DKA0_DERSI|nr:hypothetical protein HPB49_019518 [Dermacentor silvarum]